MSGGSGNDVIKFTLSDANSCFNNDFNLDGGSGDDLISIRMLYVDGSAGSATGTTAANNVNIRGGLGADTIQVAAGTTDAAFVLQYLNASEGGDRVAGLGAGHALGIAVEGSNFGGGTGTGQIAAADFVQGTAGAITAANHHWLYNTVDNALVYDADGNGTGAGVTLAQFNAAVNLITASSGVNINLT
jgi:hypothetical protein